MRNLYNWTISWAHHAYASVALFGVSFIESSFFPIPPDPLLMLMTALYPRDWFKNALLATSGSVLGGLFGYFIGSIFYEEFGKAIISFYGFEKLFSEIGSGLNHYSFFAIFAAGLTFIPFKIFTIASGVFGVPLPVFVLASVLSRGIRFFSEAAILYFVGIKAHYFIEKHFNILAASFVGLFILGYAILSFLVK